MTLRSRRVIVVIAISAVLLIAVWWSGNDALRLIQSTRPSVSHGTTGEGWLERGKRLPTSGPNFHAYSRLGALLGRASVHSTVRDILLSSFDRMSESGIDAEFVYGETGLPSGGPFPPHRTHENGSSVDVFVPMLGADGARTSLPTWPWNKFGYGIEFDTDGRWKGYRIDFGTLARFLLDLQEVAAEHGVPIARVILTPDFQDELQETEVGREALRRLPWMRGRPWVRHDEHFHVDFAVPGSNGLR